MVIKSPHGFEGFFIGVRPDVCFQSSCDVIAVSGKWLLCVHGDAGCIRAAMYFNRQVGEIFKAR